MKIALEDYCEDIVGKAQRGLGVSDESLLKEAGVSADALRTLKSGKGDDATARKVAPHLRLDAEKLVASLRGDWYPGTHDIDGLRQTNTPYHDMFVNAYLVWDSEQKVGAFFDTGATAEGLLAKAREEKLEVPYLFLTHTHADHILDLQAVKAAYPRIRVCVGEREPLEGAESIAAGARFSLGGLTVSSRLTWGHSKGGITYVIEGLKKPVAIVGDAMFAGSMGGGMVSYEDALRTNREEILSLPDDTILCPGHGPRTTVAEEKAHNPFF